MLNVLVLYCRSCTSYDQPICTFVTARTTSDRLVLLSANSHLMGFGRAKLMWRRDSLLLHSSQIAIHFRIQLANNKPQVVGVCEDMAVVDKLHGPVSEVEIMEISKAR